MARAGEVNGGERSRSRHAVAGQGGCCAPRSNVASAPRGATVLPNSFLSAGLHLLEDEDDTAQQVELVWVMMGFWGTSDAIRACSGCNERSGCSGCSRYRAQQAARRCRALPALAQSSSFPISPAPCGSEPGLPQTAPGCSPNPYHNPPPAPRASASPELSHPSTQPARGIFHVYCALGAALLTRADCFRKRISSCHERCLRLI